METTQTKTKLDYPALVRQRAQETHEKIMNSDSDEHAIGVIYEALKTTALESWKNGISAGTRKARGGARA